MILELGILVSFENVTGARLPVLAAEHKEEERIHDKARRARTQAWVDDAVDDLGAGRASRGGKLAETTEGMRPQ